MSEPTFWAKPGEGTRWVSIGDMSDGAAVSQTDRELTDAGLRDRRLEVGPPGTLLFAMYASVGAVAELAVPATWNQALLGIQVHPQLADRRFVRYWLEHLRPSYSALVRSNTQDNLNAEQVGNLPVPSLALETQRAIADFLDAETARIDALITKKRRMIELFRERVTSEADVLMREVPTVALRRVADTLAGFTFPSDTFGPDMRGPRLLRGVNVAPGSIRWDDCVRLADDGVNLRRYELEAGDVVLGMDRPFVGGGTRVAVVDESSAGALLVQRVCRIRVQQRDYAAVLRWSLGGPAFRRHVEADLTGVSVPHLSEEQIASFGVPRVDSQEASEIARRIRVLEAREIELRDRLSRQLALLQEHRQALITAAVTGELEIPEVAA